MNASRRARWTAGRNGIAHLRRAGSRVAACGASSLDERLAWPATSTCPACLDDEARRGGVPRQLTLEEAERNAT